MKNNINNIYNKTTTNEYEKKYESENPDMYSQKDESVEHQQESKHPKNICMVGIMSLVCGKPAVGVCGCGCGKPACSKHVKPYSEWKGVKHVREIIEGD